MQSLYANTWNEAIKLLLQTKTKLALAAAALVPVLAAIWFGRLANGLGLSLGRDFPLLMLDLFASILFPLFLFMAAAESFSGEYAAGTIQLVLLRPSTRAAAFAGKVLALIAYAALLLAVVWVVSVAAGLALDARTTLAGLPDSLIAYAACFVAMAAVACTAAFVAQWVRSGVGALALCVILYVAAKLLTLAYPQAAVWSLFAYTDWHALWTGGAVAAGTLLHSFLFLLSGGTIMYTAGWFMFERKSF